MKTRGPLSPAADHPGPATFVDLAEGKLSPAAADRVMEHARACSACRSEIEAWSALVRTLRAEGAELPPEELRTWARRLPVSLKAVERPARAGLLKLVADSWNVIRGALTPALARPALALRAASHRAGRRRLLFSTRQFDLDLEIDYPGTTDPRHLHGQLLPAQGARRLWAGGRVELAGPTGSSLSTQLDRRGEFHFPRVPPGRYRLEVVGPARGRSAAVDI